MTEFATPDAAARAALKDALSDALRDNRDWLRELIQEALLDMADAEARRDHDLRGAHAERHGAYRAPHGQA